MDINDIIQRPEIGSTYTMGEVPPFVINTQSTILAELAVDGETVFSGSYTPGFDGMVVVDFGGIYDSFLETDFPSKGKVEISHSSYRRLFTATFITMIGEDTTGEPPVFSWYVANAASKCGSTFGAWSSKAFLTRQPKEKPTYYDAPEWLTWLDLVGGSRLVVRFYRKNGDLLDLQVATVLSPGCHSANVSYKRLIRMVNVLPNNLNGYYDLILFNEKGKELTRQRYLYKERTGLERYYCFVNNLGGIDTLVCQGENVLQPVLTHNVGRFRGDEYASIDDTDDTLQWKQSTGMMPYRWRDWVAGLLAVKKGAMRYDPDTACYNEIVVTSSEVDMGDAGQLASAAFGYMMANADPMITDEGQTSESDMHQSAVNAVDALADASISESLVFDSGVTEAIEVNSEKLLVSLNGMDVGTVVTYLVDGEVAGTITVADDDDPVELTIPYGASVSFLFNSASADAVVTLNYYEGWHSEDFFKFAWSRTVCVQKEPPYLFSWNGVVCVQRDKPCRFTWSEAVCVSVADAYSFSWREAVCVKGLDPYSFSWREAVCVKQYIYELEWIEIG